MEDFGKPCFAHGIIVAVPMTVFAGLLIGALVYVLVRQAKRNSSKVKDTMDKESNSNVKETCEPDNSKCFQQEKSRVRSFVIDIPEYEVRQESVYKTIQEIKPPSIHWTDEESLSDSGSSTLSVSSLSEGEVDIAMVADV